MRDWTLEYEGYDPAQERLRESLCTLGNGYFATRGADGPGLALEEIRELLDVREEGVCASARSRMLSLVAGRIAETDRRIAELRAFSAHLAGVHAELSGPAPTGACGPDCGCTTTGAPSRGPGACSARPRSPPVRCCCADPLLAVLGGIGVTSAIGALWMPVLAVLAVAAGLGVVVVHGVSVWASLPADRPVVDKRPRSGYVPAKNIAAQTAFGEAVITGNLDALDEIVAPDSIDHDPAPGQMSGAEGYKAMFGELRAAFPDLNVEVEHLVATDDELAFAYSITGTHLGPLMGQPATGKKVSYRGMQISRFDSDGKLVERWGSSDELGMLRQLGLAEM
jgi:steroid delta-isomerase-like uncharacterized protein